MVATIHIGSRQIFGIFDQTIYTWQSCQSLRVGRASRSWRAASAWPGSSDPHSASEIPGQNCRTASSRGWRWRPVCSRMNWRTRRRRVWRGRRGCHCPGSGGSCAASSTAPSSPSWAWSLVTDGHITFDTFLNLVMKKWSHGSKEDTFHEKCVHDLQQSQPLREIAMSSNEKEKVDTFKLKDTVPMKILNTIWYT